ncbi:hypothetical protein, partial [Micromonospora echinofusca]|uniref:hypothetical protein n=1 Tax=Micromonospora echinofusca TaxID=47858 RepID=UPI0033D38201
MNVPAAALVSTGDVSTSTAGPERDVAASGVENRWRDASALGVALGVEGSAGAALSAEPNGIPARALSWPFSRACNAASACAVAEPRTPDAAARAASSIEVSPWPVARLAAWSAITSPA